MDNDRCERESAVVSIFAAFGREIKNEPLSFIIQKTRGITITNFLDACKKIETYEELPRNISREIISLSCVFRDSFVLCDKCAVYIDGVKTDSAYVPGLQKHQKTTGDIYDRVGYSAPCTCYAGQKILRQLQSMEDNWRTGLHKRPVAVDEKKHEQTTKQLDVYIPDQLDNNLPF